MLSAFQHTPLIIISINRLRHQPANILTASLKLSFNESTSLSNTEFATYYSTPLGKARHHLQHDYTVLHSKKVHDQLTALYTPAAQDPQDPNHKDAKYIQPHSSPLPVPSQRTFLSPRIAHRTCTQIRP
jgi:hypothetical protein